MSVVSLSMDLDDIVRKFPDDIPRRVGLEILNFAEIKRADGEEFKSYTYKRDVVAALKDNKVKIEKAFGVDFKKYLKEMEKRQQNQAEQLEELDSYVEEKNEEDSLVDDSPLPSFDFDLSTVSENDILTIDPAAKIVASKDMSETLGDDRLSDIDKIGTGLVKRWMVRYIGKKGKVELAPTSTHSGKGYLFHRDMWVDVDEKDFRRRFYPKMKNAIENQQDPLWQIKIETLQGKVLDFFKAGVNSVVKSKPQVLKDVKHLTSDRLNRLYRYEIESLVELKRVPKERLIEILGVNRVIATEILEDARRS